MCKNFVVDLNYMLIHFSEQHVRYSSEPTRMDIYEPLVDNSLFVGMKGSRNNHYQRSIRLLLAGRPIGKLCGVSSAPNSSSMCQQLLKPSFLVS